MGFVELFLIAVGLSMDAFAAAVCKGLSMKRFDPRAAFVLALFFGGFQALMPFLGWLLGSQFFDIIAPIDHWVAFVLLAFIGGRMLIEVFKDDGEEQPASEDARIDVREYLVLAIATSIDALAVGITFSALDVAIGPSVAIIGVTTFVLSFAGAAIGNAFGARFEKPATIIGGVILIAIGIKILIEHLMG